MTRLDRRALTLGLAALAATPAVLPGAAAARALSAADQALVQKAVAYLQGLKEAKGRFVQTDARGVTSQGDIYLQRPGKARFEYAPPSGLLVVSDGGKVSVANSKLKTFESYPLGLTPLSLFLAREIRLDRGVNITRVTRLTDGFAVTARDGKKEAEGQIVLNFADDPMRLLGWTITDAQGQTTRIRLTRLERASGLPARLFELEDPRPRNPGRARM